MNEAHFPKPPNGTAARPLVIALLSVLALVGLSPALAASRTADYPAAPRLERGQSLSDAVRFLGKQAGVNVDWALKEDYWLDNDLDLPGHGLEQDVQWAIDSYKPKGALTRVVARATGRTLKVSRSERLAAPATPLAVARPAVAAPPVRMPVAAASPAPVRAQLPAMGATALELAPLRTSVTVPAPSIAAAQPAKPVITSPVAAALALEPTPEPAPVATAPPAIPAQVWKAANGSTLQTAVRDWAQRAGWTVVWNDKRPDLEIVGTVEVSGDIVKAVSYLFDVYRRSGATYAVDIYTQQKLVLVKDN